MFKAMRNQFGSVVIALVLGCLPVQMMVCEVGWAQKTITIDLTPQVADTLNKVGVQLASQGKINEAIATFQDALNLYKGINNLAGQEIVLNNIGSVYLSTKKYPEALEYFQQLLVTTGQTKNRALESQTLTLIGLVYRNLNEYLKAVEHYQKALTISKETNDLPNQGVILTNLGKAYSHLEQDVKALEYFQKALTIRKRIRDLDGVVRVLSSIGNTYRNLGQYPKALEYYEQALVIVREKKDNAEIGRILISIGETYAYSGQYTKAAEYYEQALAIIRKDNNPNEIGSLLNTISEIYLKNTGQYAKSLEYLQEELIIQKKTNSRLRIGQILNNIGAIYRIIGQYDKALKYYQQALVIRKEITFYPAGVGITLNNMGLVYERLGQYDEALKYYQQAMVVRKEVNDKFGEAVTLNNIGLVYSSLRKYDEALKYFLQASVIQEILGGRVEVTNLHNIGAIYAIIGQNSKALDYCQKSLVISKKIGNRSGEASALSCIGASLYFQSKNELSILFYKESVKIHESIRKDLRNLSQEEKQSFTRTIANTYQELADFLIKQGRVTEALQVLDLLKIQELDDYLKNVKGNNITEKGVELLAPEKAISDQLSSLSLDKIPELNQQLVSKLQKLPKSEINKVPPYFQNIPQGAVLIYPFILEDRLELIIYSPNTLPINRTIPIKKEELQQLVTDFRQDLQGNGSENIKISSKKLYDLLIKPIEAELQQSNATTILYAPDGLLRYIPLAALYDGKQYLIEKYRINNLIAYSLFDQNRKAQTNPSIFAGAYGNSNQRLVSGFSQLPATIPEVDSIQTTFANTTKITEKDFTAQASKDKAVGNSIVHLATHASFRSGSPLDSYVLFGDGSKATIFDISEWNLKDVNLFVLSACQTGLGTSANGAEILGFGYQVQRAGAKASIASLWEVSDGGTQLLMQAFYSQIKQGNISTSEALRQAQIAMINSDKKVEGSDRTGIKIVGTLPNNPDGKLSHPYYWSAFVLIGNGL